MPMTEERLNEIDLYFEQYGPYMNQLSDEYANELLVEVRRLRERYETPVESSVKGDG
jgi:hypothetical protein